MCKRIALILRSLLKQDSRTFFFYFLEVKLETQSITPCSFKSYTMSQAIPNVTSKALTRRDNGEMTARRSHRKLEKDRRFL